MLSYYGRLSSEVYDMDKPIGHSFGDIEFYKERLKSCEGRILEPATGTGRMLIPLLENGFEVDGFDCSKEMLNICENNCRIRNLKPYLFEAKMESFSIDRLYDAIIVPTGTFLLLQERTDSIKALHNFYKHLSNGGKLIIDIFLQTNSSIGISSTRTFPCDNGDIITLDKKIVQVDNINQFTISHTRYEKWRDGVLLETELEYFPLRWYGVEEFKLILESIGFDDIVISSDYKFGQYPVSAEKVITFEATAIK
ncbi:MAG: methylase involved in ubiquinone/menaquinone biosynthesis [Herbinix sp.]|jgi:SAM-dependent methyltransferase|nr:methylase involved in ubiquinone/menaquinone biosynthesis [Herbinix sp.]